MSLLESSKKFLQKLIRTYYKTKPLIEPYYLPKREIAIYSLEDEVYIRHLGFPSMTLLYKYILNTKTPIHLYYSSAYYEDPTADKMELKGWLGSDLIFDIDSDHYPGCDRVLSICISTNEVYDGKIKMCRNSEKPIIYPLIDFTCIRKGWNDTVKLVEILRDDFGYKNIHVFYSGNRGFHIHVYDEEVLRLESEQRREIADYITFKNIALDKIVPPVGKRKKYAYFINKEYGWRKRILQEITSIGEYERIHGYIRVSYDLIEAIIENIGINIDPVVTMDTSRLSRFGRSFHGKSGLIVYPLDYSRTDINEYNYTDFTPFDGKLIIKPLVTISGLKVLDQKIDLKKGLRISVDAYIGVFLALKGLAVISEISRVGVKNV